MKQEKAVKSLATTIDRNSLSSRLRAKRDARLRELISVVHHHRGTVRIIDLGGRSDYWKRVGVDFLRACKAHVTITNLSERELSRDTYNEDIFSFAIGNACDLLLINTTTERGRPR